MITSALQLAQHTPLMNDESELIWQQIGGSGMVATDIAQRRYCIWWPRKTYPRRLSKRLAKLGMGPQLIE